MPESNLFEQMLATYPAERRELARQSYHRFADGDDTQFFSQLFLLLDVYGHYIERIPARMISANADSLATMQELREEVGLLAKTIETRDANITNQARSLEELCQITMFKCNETIATIESTVKNLGTHVDTQAIVQGINATLESGIRREVVAPFLKTTEELAQKTMPTLEKIRDMADEAKSEWTKRIWKTVWTTCLFWSIGTAIILASLIALACESHYHHKMVAQIADMAEAMKYNHEAFRKLAIAQVPVKVMSTQNQDGTVNPHGFVLVIDGAYAAEMQQKAGCIFFNSAVPENQLRHLLQDTENPTQTPDNPAK